MFVTGAAYWLQRFSAHSMALRMTCQACTTYLPHDNVGNPPSHNTICWHLWCCVGPTERMLDTSYRHLLQTFATLFTRPPPHPPHATSCPIHDSCSRLQLGDGKKVFCKVERSHRKPSTAWWRPTTHQVREEKKVLCLLASIH